MTEIRVYRIPFSTNVERVALALAYKGLPVEWVDVDPDDRAEVVRASGQDLVPVLEHGERVLVDSAAILEYLEQQFPLPPLLPNESARRAEVRIFCDWFNRVWKRPPNLVVVERAKAEPDPGVLTALGNELTTSLELFEDLLTGREFLFEGLSLADVTAFPFLKYGLLWTEGDSDPFHGVLRSHLKLGRRYPRLEAWIRRLDALPRA